MIRFILRRETLNEIHMATETYRTIDIEVEELEELLNRGGHGEDSFDITHLVGCELL